jgi:hypothetical protein
MLKICLFFTASNSAQKNFLYENLGMYTQSLYKSIKQMYCFVFDFRIFGSVNRNFKNEAKNLQ